MPRASRTGVRGLFRNADGRWRIDLRWRESGTGEYRRFQEMLPDDIKAPAAKARARKHLQAALAGGWNPKAEGERKLKAALEEYIKWRTTNGRAAVEASEATCTRFVASFGDVELSAVSPFAVERFKRDRYADGAGPATVNRALALLRHFYGLAAKWGWVSTAHAAAIRGVASMKEAPGRVRYLSPDEESAVMTALEDRPRFRRVVVTALLTGMRQGELLRLRAEAVDLAAGEITLTRTKSNKVRRIPIGPALVPVLKEAISASASGFVFESRKREPYTKDGLRSAWDRVAEEAKLEDFHFHDLRHSFATALRRRGAGLDVIQRLLGHSTLAMVMRYAHVGEDMVRTAINALPAPVASPLPHAPALALAK
jgi:integrase